MLINLNDLALRRSNEKHIANIQLSNQKTLSLLKLDYPGSHIEYSKRKEALGWI